MGQFASNCTKVDKDKENVGSNGTGVDQLNFKEFEDDESCESGDSHCNLGEFKDQDNVLTDQDKDSIDDIFIDNSFVLVIIQNNEHQATIGRVLFRTEHSRPDVL